MKPVTPGTKTAAVLNYLKTGHSLDFPKAIGMWGHIRLSDVIFRLRKKGYPITTEVVTNGKVEFAIYRLPQEAPTKAAEEAKQKTLKKGAKVRVRDTAECDSFYHGKEGFIRSKCCYGTYDWNVHIIGKSGTVAFYANELEAI